MGLNKGEDARYNIVSLRVSDKELKSINQKRKSESVSNYLRKLVVKEES